MLVAGSAVCTPERGPYTGGFVRRADALPFVSGMLQRLDRPGPVLVRKEDLAAREVHHGVERRGPALADLVRVDRLLHLVRCRARRLQIACRNRDLDLRGEPAEPEEGALCFLQRALHSGQRGIDLALGEPDEREPRLWLAAKLARDAIRVLRSHEVAAAAADLADLVPAGGGDHLVEVLELFAGRERLRLRRRPVAAQAHRLRAVHPAGAGETRDVQRVAPPIRRLRPLRCSAVVADVLARADRDAVDEAGRVSADVTA